MEYPQTDTSAPPHQAQVGAVVGPQYCCPNPVDLTIVRKLRSRADKFTVTDINGNVVFKLQAPPLSIYYYRLLDATQNPVLNLRRVMSFHNRWKVFRGDSSDPRDLIFDVKRSSMFQLKTKLDVFLASNTSQQVCDFKVKVSCLERSCVVYAGESDNIIAQMKKKNMVKNMVLERANFMVTVYPNVDYAFIATLIIIIDEMELNRH